MTDGKPYAICTNCPEKFDDRAQMTVHLRSTFDASAKEDGHKKGHQTRIVNFTEEEKIEQRIDREIEDGILEIVANLGREVDLGRLTQEAITARIGWHGWSFEDAWSDYLEES